MPIHQIDAATLNQWLQDGGTTLVDVREPPEHQVSHIAGAQLHPLSRFDAGAVAATPGRLVLHCPKGGRSQMACEKVLAENPALEIYNLTGGIGAWAAAGLPVVEGE